MLKNNKGISLITLIVTIVVMIILASIIISSSLDSVEETNITKINNEIKDLKIAVGNRIANYERNNTLYPMVGKKVEDSLYEYIRSIETLTLDEINEIIDKLSTVYSEKTKEYYRLVGKKEAEILGVEGVDGEHYYVVDYYECEVYGPVELELAKSVMGD